MTKKTPNPKGKKAPKKLTDDLRREVVARLAMYDTFAQVQAWLLDEHDVTISVEGLRHYDPSTPTGSTTAQKWVDLFHAVRTDFLKEVSKVPIAHRAWRLRRLSEDYENTRIKDPDTARKMLEQAAKEVERFWMPSKSAAAGNLPEAPARTDDESRNMLADRLKEGIARLPANAGKSPTIQ